jgi:hypothetical protein
MTNTVLTPIGEMIVDSYASRGLAYDYHYQFTRVSSNSKIGPIPCTVTDKRSCPDSCPLKDKNGCYADLGPVGWNWDKVSKGERGINWPELMSYIKSLPDNQIWRHNIAGDLPGENESIDPVLLGELVQANLFKRGFTYTHKVKLASNIHWIRQANKCGFTVNLSANDYDDADRLKALKAGPVVTLQAIDAPRKEITAAGNTVITCPATYKDNVNCSNCQLCQISDRAVIIGFPAHGAQKNKVNNMLKNIQIIKG